ncbi:Ribokinase-like protein [Dunaliella salina]|uniref:Ribokinase-like protein n=1 Tax=Dunaliella salina TaxID=3046 RepID=A0ABQ7GYT8_DUNSA|nr:Ribokinase-like protein [Dunaliella salina]|eukprot:KAF5839767.1 Ribokinase-like protein [Dunaliella salina]
MAQLGGGGSQSLFGYQLASASISGSLAQVGLAAGVGQDFPASCHAWLSNLGVDLQGLFVAADPKRNTPRAWQVFEEDGRRTQIWRSKGDPCEALYALLRPRLDTLPQHYDQAQNFHLGAHPVTPPLELMRGLHARAQAAGGLFSVEPYVTADRPLSGYEFQELLSSCDIYSPNMLEAQTMLGVDDRVTPVELVHRLVEAGGPHGAPIIILRCGEQGAIVSYRPSSLMLTVPALTEGVNVVDVTGAGNAFCGGFLASLVKSCRGREASGGGSSGSSSSNSVSGHQAYEINQSELAEAAAWGAVSASFMIEEQGVPVTPVQELTGHTHARFDVVRRGVKVYSAARETEHISHHRPWQSKLQGSPCTLQATSSYVSGSNLGVGSMKCQGGPRLSSGSVVPPNPKHGILLRPQRQMRAASLGPAKPVQNLVSPW